MSKHSDGSRVSGGDPDPIPYQVGDRIRVNHWVVPRDNGWHYGTVLEVGHNDARIDWGSYVSIMNLRAVGHHEKVSP